MKKIVLAVLMAVGMMGTAYAGVPTSTTVTSSDAQCKYKLSDARAGLKDLTLVGFSPRGESEDHNRVFGIMVYHNAKSKSAESVDALALVMIDKAANKQLTFAVVYVGPEKSVVFKREMKDGKEPGPCFTKTLQDTPKESAK